MSLSNQRPGGRQLHAVGLPLLDQVDDLLHRLAQTPGHLADGEVHRAGAILLDHPPALGVLVPAVARLELQSILLAPARDVPSGGHPQGEIMELGPLPMDSTHADLRERSSRLTPLSRFSTRGEGRPARPRGALSSRQPATPGRPGIARRPRPGIRGRRHPTQRNATQPDATLRDSRPDRTRRSARRSVASRPSSPRAPGRPACGRRGSRPRPVGRLHPGLARPGGRSS